MPKLLMLFSGSVGFFGAYLTALISWPVGLLLVAAALAVLIVVGMRQCELYRQDPVAEVKGKMLIIAGVLSVLVALV
jgi:hypothetical protein